MPRFVLPFRASAAGRKEMSQFDLHAFDESVVTSFAARL